MIFWNAGQLKLFRTLKYEILQNGREKNEIKLKIHFDLIRIQCHWNKETSTFILSLFAGNDDGSKLDPTFQ